jgi:hypothetical protein
MSNTPPMVHDTTITPSGLHRLRSHIFTYFNGDVPAGLPVQLTRTVNGDAVIGTFGDVTLRVDVTVVHGAPGPAGPAPDPDITMTWEQFSAVTDYARHWSGDMHLRDDAGVIVCAQNSGALAAFDRTGTLRAFRATQEPWQPPTHMFGAGNDFTRLPV